jgi:hypothetical protein
MDIPNSRLNSTHATATEFQSLEPETPNQYQVAREQFGPPQSREVFASSPSLAESSEYIDSFGRRESRGTLSERLSGSLTIRQGGSFLPRSSLRALSGRIAHRPERLPCSPLFRPSHRANSPRQRPSQRNSRTVRAGLNADPWTTACQPWRK